MTATAPSTGSTCHHGPSRARALYALGDTTGAEALLEGSLERQPSLAAALLYLERADARPLERTFQVLGLALVSNAAAGVLGTPITHEEVLEAGRRAAPTLAHLIERIVARLASLDPGAAS